MHPQVHVDLCKVQKSQPEFQPSHSGSILRARMAGIRATKKPFQRSLVSMHTHTTENNTKATFTRDWAETVSNLNGSASIYMEPFGTGTVWIQMDPKQVQFWIRLDSFGTSCRMVLSQQNAQPVRFSDQLCLGLVPCKRRFHYSLRFMQVIRNLKWPF